MKKLFLALLFSGIAFCQHSNTITWTWSQGTGDPATGFHIWKVLSTGTCPAFGATPLSTISSPTTFSFTDASSTLVSGQINCYGVTAFNLGGDSGMSNIVSATTPFLVPANPPVVVSVTSK